MLPPFPITPPPVEIICASAGEAIETVQQAHRICLSASYLPQGGETCWEYIPVTHSVWVMGKPDTLKSFMETYNAKHNTPPVPQA